MTLNRYSIGGVVFFVLIWSVISFIGVISSFFLAAPWDVAFSLKHLASQTSFWNDCVSTVWRFAMGLLFGVSIGVPIGLLLGMYHKIYSLTSLIIDFFRSLPVIVLFPLFIVIFGIEDSAKIATAAFASSLLMVINTIYGVRQVRETRIEVARILRASPLAIFRKVILPETMPSILAGIRIAASFSLVVIVVTEMFMGASNGLGKRIYDAGLVYRIPEMYAIILTSGFIGYGANLIVIFLEKRIIHWTGKG